MKFKIKGVSFNTYNGNVKALCFVDEKGEEVCMNTETLNNLFKDKTIEVETVTPRKYAYIKKMSEITIKI